MSLILIYTNRFNQHMDNLQLKLNYCCINSLTSRMSYQPFHLRHRCFNNLHLQMNYSNSNQQIIKLRFQLINNHMSYLHLIICLFYNLMILMQLKPSMNHPKLNLRSILNHLNRQNQILLEFRYFHHMYSFLNQNLDVNQP